MHVTYQTVDEFLVAASRVSAVNAANTPLIEQQKHRMLLSPRWFGFSSPTSFDATVKIVRNGWLDGLARIENALGSTGAHIAPPITQKRRKIRTAQGDEIDMHRVWAGDLDHAWSATRRQARIGPRHMTVVCDLCTPSNESSDTQFWRGAAAIRLADLLTAAGYSTRLLSSCTTISNADEHIQVDVVIKDFAAPLDKTSVSTVALPAFTRGLCYVWSFVFGERRNDYSLGSVGFYKVAVRDELVVSRVVRDQFTAQQWVEQQIRDINAQHEEMAA